jgi:phytoene dehydrogenase-like protein
MTERIERQIARFAPGFCERVLVRRATSTAELESINANLIGGAITGGANDLWQMVARPTLSAMPYRTPIKESKVFSFALHRLLPAVVSMGCAGSTRQMQL